MNYLLIGLIVFVFLIFLRMHKMIKKYKINFKYMFLNYVVLIFILLANLPVVLGLFENYLNIRTRFEIMLIILFIYLMYNNFILELHIAKRSQEIEKIISQLAIMDKNEESTED